MVCIQTLLDTTNLEVLLKRLLRSLVAAKARSTNLLLKLDAKKATNEKDHEAEIVQFHAPAEIDVSQDTGQSGRGIKMCKDHGASQTVRHNFASAGKQSEHQNLYS